MRDEGRLIDGIRAGSRTDFSTLVEKYAPEVYAFLARISGPHAAEELSHRTFQRAWRGASTYHSDRPLRVWLLGLAVREAGAHEGFDGRWEAAARVELGAPGGGATSSEAQDAPRLAARAVAELPFAQRVALVLKAYREFGVPEIAATLDAPGDVVAALLAAAFNSFVNRLQVRSAV
jgi:RNA polymerase sigma-70 factor (ECF subfamily)